MDSGLEVVIKNKNFKTFWHCLDYLMVAGYSPVNSLAISLKEFGENNIFNDVGYIKISQCASYIDVNGCVYRTPDGKVINHYYKLIIGIIDEENNHLRKLFEIYRGHLNKGNDNEEIERLCKQVITTPIPPFILSYIREIARDHYKYDIFKIGFDNEPNSTPSGVETGIRNIINGLAFGDHIDNTETDMDTYDRLRR